MRFLTVVGLAQLVVGALLLVVNAASFEDPITGGDAPARDGVPRADLTDAHLSGAQLSGANLTDARRLTQKQVDGAFGDSWTVLPDQLAHPASWPELEFG